MIDAALLLPRILERAGTNQELAEAAAITAWKRVAGEGLAAHVAPIGMRETILTVAVADDVWKKQLERMSRELTARINQLLRREVVTEIQFRVNARASKTKPGAGSAKTHKVLPPPENVLASAAQIEDVELRERFIRAATNCIDRREARKFEIRDPQSEI